MTRRGRRIDLVVMLVFCSLGQSGDAQTSQETRAAFVLLSQLETVAYARSDFLFSPDAFDLSRVDPENNLRFPFIELIGGIKALGPNTGSNLAKFYRGYLVGAKDFGFGTSAKPDELGMVGSRQCFVGILEGGPQPNLEREFSQTSHVTMSGVQVWSWSIPPSENESEPTTYYAAQIGSSYLVIANDRQVFQDAANALRRTLSSKPRSITVFGWETFSKYNYWIYRLSRRAGVIDPESAGISDLSQDVSAITVFYERRRKTSGCSGLQL